MGQVPTQTGKKPFQRRSEKKRRKGQLPCCRLIICFAAFRTGGNMFIYCMTAIALFALSRYLQIPWHIAAAAGGVGQVVIVSVLLLIVLEQRRKRLIRQAQEFTFLNHHIRNAITQMTMASYLSDPDKQQRIRCEALERISGALRRIANSVDLDGLSLEIDLTGAELMQEAADGEEVGRKRTA
jgi:hypothetical protein